jgi:GTP:adenosylcobinamide-phosphate guanylyltransferase
MNVVMTAGGRIDGPYAAEAGATVKALVEIRGETMLARAITAARDAGASQIAVVGDSGVRKACGAAVDVVVPESQSGAENLLRALRVWPGDEPLLLLTTDLPYLDAVALRSFLDAAPSDVLAMPVCTPERFEARFPGAPPVGITLGFERVVNGGAFLFAPGHTARVAEIATRFFDARKSPWKMAAVLGASLAFRFATKRLTVAALEEEAPRRFGVAIKAVRACAPELCFDADTVEDYRYVVAHP